MIHYTLSSFLFDVGLIIVALIFSAFFSGSETALTAASKSRMHNMAKSGNERAKIVNTLRHEKETLLSSLLFGNTVVNIVSSALATKVFLELFGDAGVAYATLVMTFFILLFGEVMPKTYAFLHPDESALFVSPIIRVLVVIFKPITRAISLLARILFFMFGADTKRKHHYHHEEELRGAIDLYQGEEEEIKDERDMLKSILDLNDVTIDEIMTHRKSVEAIDIDLPLNDIAKRVLASPYTRLPLWQDDPDNIVGILNTKAFFREVNVNHQDINSVNLRKISTTPWFVPESITLFDQLKAFRQKREHFALVVDEYGSYMGIVTLEDILEEIVGDIHDEHDIRVIGVTKQEDGSYIVEGKVTIRDLNREFEWSLPDQQASTIAGLVLYEAKQLPKVGQSFVFYEFRFEIIERKRNQISKLKIIPPLK